MPLAIIQQVQEQAAASIDKARTDYKSLLGRANAPKPGDAKLLANALNTLGLTPQDFEEDATALSRVPQLESSQIAPAEIEKLHDAMKTKLQALRDAEAAAVKLVNDARQALGTAEGTWRAAGDKNLTLKSEADRLRREHPRAFADSWPEPTQPAPPQPQQGVASHHRSLLDG